MRRLRLVTTDREAVKLCMGFALDHAEEAADVRARVHCVYVFVCVRARVHCVCVWGGGYVRSCVCVCLPLLPLARALCAIGVLVLSVRLWRVRRALSRNLSVRIPAVCAVTCVLALCLPSCVDAHTVGAPSTMLRWWPL